MSPAADIRMMQPGGGSSVSRFTAPGLDDLLVYGTAGSGPGAKERLAGHLCASLAGLSPAWALRLGRGPVVVKTGNLGLPILEVGGEPGPAISFSHGGHTLWGALAANGRVGLDVACSEDFAGAYPFVRAFRPQEFAAALRHCRGDAAAAAALLWALKEAAVKALGTGFHCHDPLEVETVNPLAWQGGWRVEVRAGIVIPAWVRPQGTGWLAIASY